MKRQFVMIMIGSILLAARNAGRRGYRFQQAQRTAQAREQQIRHQPRKLMSHAIARTLRAERWSPEQISFWLWNERGLSLSHAWIPR